MSHFRLSFWFICALSLMPCLHAAIEPLPPMSMQRIYVEGKCKLIYKDNKSSNIDLVGAFSVGVINGKIVYRKFIPSSETYICPYAEETIRHDNIVTFINRSSPKSPTKLPTASVSPQDKDRDYSQYSDLEAIKAVKKLLALKDLISTGSIRELGANHYLLERMGWEANGLMIPHRQVEVETDGMNRATSITVSFKANTQPQYVQTYNSQIQYKDNQLLPSKISTVWNNKTTNTDQVSEVWDYTEIITDKPFDDKMRPTLLESDTYVTDYRFTPPLEYQSVGHNFPTEKQLFAIAAQKEAEREAKAKLFAKAQQEGANPRNIPTTAPVVGESWTKRLRQIPNWAYLSIIGAIALIWGVARLRRKK
ncbi:hypothetical protein GX645_06665 [Candidatus Sumerlaeota bacterium]|nr:hypothetical protein [Candidatus Sumerlaeales bacterium]NLD62120.1 hypothetical protein [Candidatus Sumerlaeota bacterium]